MFGRVPGCRRAASKLLPSPSRSDKTALAVQTTLARGSGSGPNDRLTIMVLSGFWWVVFNARCQLALIDNGENGHNRWKSLRKMNLRAIPFFMASSISAFEPPSPDPSYRCFFRITNPLTKNPGRSQKISRKIACVRSWKFVIFVSVGVESRIEVRPEVNVVLNAPRDSVPQERKEHDHERE